MNNNENVNTALPQDAKNINVWLEAEEKVTLSPSDNSKTGENAEAESDSDDYRPPITVIIEENEDLTVRPVMPPMPEPKSS